MDKDPVAARQYFETAANLGDSDAMNEAAWCYVEGFGGRKDKVGVHVHADSTHANVSVRGCEILPACRGKGE